MKRIWYDVTEIYEWRGHHTGIQRVIFMIGSQLAQDPRFSVKYCRYDRRTKKYTEVAYTFVEHQYAPRKKAEKPKKPSLLVRARILALGFIPLNFKLLAKQVIKLLVRIGRPIAPAPFGHGDTLFIPGAFWTDFMPAVAEVKRRHGLEVVGVMYDLVPLVASQYNPFGTVLDYRRDIGKAVKTYDRWFAISENTKADFLQYADEHRLKVAAGDVHIIRLGSDIDVHGDAKPLKQKGKEIKDYILCVGTLEPRKNQMLVYQAVKRALERGDKLPLVVLAGKGGWLSGDLTYMLKNDKSIRGHILWQEDVDDRTLRWLYQHCMFTVYPSHYEGWGLPVAESLAYGKTCITAHNSSLPEIAGDAIRYVSSHSADELLAAMQEYARDKRLLSAAEKRAKAFQQTTWKQAYDQVAEIL